MALSRLVLPLGTQYDPVSPCRSSFKLTFPVYSRADSVHRKCHIFHFALSFVLNLARLL